MTDYRNTIKTKLDSVTTEISKGGLNPGKLQTSNAIRPLITLGQESGFVTCPEIKSGLSSAVYGTWLFDLCWLEYPAHDKETRLELKKIPLVFGVEWDPDETKINHAFQILIQARAETKAFVFWRPPQTTSILASQFLKIETSARNFSPEPENEEQYLLCCFEQAASKFSYYTFEIKNTRQRTP